MQIELPDDVGERLRRAAEQRGATPSDVILRALDSLEWIETERLAVQAGIDDMQAGRCQLFDEFDRDFRERNGIRQTD